MNKQALKQLVGDEWFEIINNTLTPAIQFEIDGIRELYNRGLPIYPEPNNVWKAFELCPLDKLKVIWIAQDPYPNPPGQATGLAFDCGVNISPSMKHIQEAYQDCFPTHFNTDIMDGKLSYLCNEGVLLLNTSLTVEAGKPNSHKHYWDKFMMYLLKNISEYDDSVIVICMGKQAQDYMYATKFTNLINIEHPAYAARQGRKWKHDNFFLKVNEMLKQQNKQEIKW
jgi:uracil-DNA glycosylase